MLGSVKNSGKHHNNETARGLPRSVILLKVGLMLNLRAVVMINILIAIFTKVKMKSLETTHAKFGNVLSKTINWEHFFLI